MSATEELLARYERAQLHNSNEAETRYKLVDDTIHKVLSWPKEEVSVELRSIDDEENSKFADYVITTGMSGIVVECKRVGVSFSDIPNKRKARLSEIASGNGPTAKAIRQVRQYAHDLSVPFAAVTNGAAWIIFPAQRIDLIPLSETYAIIFPDLNSILKDRLREFQDLLSREAVINSSLENELLNRVDNQTEPRRLNVFYNGGFTKRNRQSSIFPAIENAVNIAFTDQIMDYPDLIEKAYVGSSERTKFDQKVKMHLQRRNHHLPSKPLRPLDGDSPKLKNILERTVNNIKPLALLILGEVGSGKSTFINYARHVTSKAFFEHHTDQPYPHWIYVDFRDFPPSSPPHQFIVNAIKAYIQNDPFLSDHNRCLQYAYKEEVEALKRGPLHFVKNDPEKIEAHITDLYLRDFNDGSAYVRKILAYASKNVPVYLVIDNVDQFPEDVQSAVFSDAMAFSHEISLNLICSLRPGTYHQHRHSAVFDAFEHDILFIDAPPTDMVLSRRFAITKALLQGKSYDFVSERGQTTHVEDLATVGEMIQGSVVGTEVGEFIGYAAGSNIREALEMVRTFLRCGYSEPGYGISVFQSAGKYILPRHEAVRGIILGDEDVYKESHSLIANPFDAHLGRTEAQFLRLFVLSGLVELSRSRSFTHLEGRRLVELMNQLGFGKGITKDLVISLQKSRLVENDSYSSDIESGKFRPTRLGGYLLRKLISEFMFVENMLMDTFIPDKNVWIELDELCRQIDEAPNKIERLRLRVQRAKIFYDSVLAEYDKIKALAVKKGLPPEWCISPIADRYRQFVSDYERATLSASARRNQ